MVSGMNNAFGLLEFRISKSIFSSERLLLPRRKCLAELQGNNILIPALSTGGKMGFSGFKNSTFTASLEPCSEISAETYLVSSSWHYGDAKLDINVRLDI